MFVTISHVWLIFWREYSTRVKNKWFLLTTFLAPLGILLIMGISIFTSYQAQVANGNTSVLIIDPAGIIGEQYPDLESYSFTQVETQPDQTQIQTWLFEEEYDFILELPLELPEQGVIQIPLYRRAGNSLTDQFALQSFVQSQVLSYQITQANFTPQQVSVLQTQVSLQSQIVAEDGQTEEDYSAVAYILGYLSGFVIYFSLFIYGTMIMRSVIEEKSSRVIEIIISSVKPLELMLGKILGVAAVSLTQLGIWFVTLSVISVLLNQIAFVQEQLPFSLDQVQQALREANILSFLVYLPVFYLGGYLLYSALFAAVGSTVENEKDSQALVLPITIPIILAFVLMFQVLQEPQSTLAVALSLIPFTSPIIMIARVPFGVPWWQLALSVIILYGSFYVLTWIAARIYRIGILMYGKKPSLQEMWKWLRA